MAFPFHRLYAELLLEIVRFAAEPDWEESDKAAKCYETARSLCLVSHATRRAVLPLLLHTVVLPNDHSLNAFVKAVRQQQWHARSQSPLAVDYSRFIRRLWFGDCWEALEQCPVDEEHIDYDTLFTILSHSHSLGLSFQALHLLYNTLGTRESLDDEWSCRRITLSGSYWRWKPVISTPEGISFLSRITHLVLWITWGDPLRQDVPANGAYVASWVKDVPLGMMPNLTHFAFPLYPCLTKEGWLCAPDRMLVYQARDSSKDNSQRFREWAMSSQPLEHGAVVRLKLVGSGEGARLDSQLAFVQGQSELIWETAQQLPKGIA